MKSSVIAVVLIFALAVSCFAEDSPTAIEIRSDSSSGLAEIRLGELKFQGRIEEISLRTDSDGKPAGQFRLSGPIEVEGPEFRCTAERLDFDLSQNILKLSGSKDRPVRFWSQRGDAKTELKAAQILFDVGNHSLRAEGAGAVLIE